MISHFPSGYTPKPFQSELIKKIEDAFKRKKFVIVSAPTGTGKSFLSATLSNASNPPTQKFKDLVNSYEAFYQDSNGAYIKQDECLEEPPFGAFVLTITKALQDQYVGLFEDSSIFKGKTNYVCDVDGVSDVEVAPCLMTPRLKDDCWRKNRCPYYVARNHALTNRFTTLNYKLFFTLPDHVKHKEYIICDEASELENEIVQNFTLSIDFDKVKKYNIPIPQLNSENVYEAIRWVEDNQGHVQIHLEDMVNSFTNSKRSISERERIEYLYTKNLYNNFVKISTYKDEASWVVDKQDKVLNFVPLKVDTLSQNIFRFSEKVLLMSATIIDPKKYASVLGIKDYEYIEAESHFDPDKSPIFVSTEHKLNYKNLPQKLPLLAKQIKEICDHHKNVKGIIHTHTMYIADELKRYLGNDDRFLFRGKEATNDMLLKEHAESDKPTVLVSPSLSFGVDLKDDLGRFCIVVKMPYLPLSDKRIKKIFDSDKVWYINAMLNGLVQMCGRCTRSEDDFSETYILDGNIQDILDRNSQKLPKYFTERIH
jgi:Rad3-related DNA helicase